MAATKPRIATMPFGKVYPLYVQKAEKKGRTRAEVDEVIRWLTGYSAPQLAAAVRSTVDLETFFADAPALNPNARLITGVVCGVRVEEVEDPLMRNVRYLDKLVDELAKGKALERVLRKAVVGDKAAVSGKGAPHANQPRSPRRRHRRLSPRRVRPHAHHRVLVEELHRVL
jgi:hypothetical protein